MIKPRDASTKDLRGFGLGLAAVFLVFAYFAWRKDSPRLPLWLSLSGAFGTCAALLPRAIGPVYRIWYPVARVLSAANTFLLLGIVYYLMLTPYSLLLRLFGVRPLELGFDPEKESYWTEKPSPMEDASPERMF